MLIGDVLVLMRLVCACAGRIHGACIRVTVVVAGLGMPAETIVLPAFGVGTVGQVAGQTIRRHLLVTTVRRVCVLFSFCVFKQSVLRNRIQIGILHVPEVWEINWT